MESVRMDICRFRQNDVGIGRQEGRIELFGPKPLGQYDRDEFPGGTGRPRGRFRLSRGDRVPRSAGFLCGLVDRVPEKSRGDGFRNSLNRPWKDRRKT